MWERGGQARCSAYRFASVSRACWEAAGTVDIRFCAGEYRRQGAAQYALKHAGRVVSFGAVEHPFPASEVFSMSLDNLGAFCKLRDLTLSGPVASYSDLTVLPPGLTRLKLHMWLGAFRINWAAFGRLQQLARLKVRARLYPRSATALLDINDSFVVALPRLKHFSLVAVGGPNNLYPISVAASSPLLHLTDLKLKGLGVNGGLYLEWMPALQTLTLKHCYLTTLVYQSLKNLALVECMWQGKLKLPPEVTAMKLEKQACYPLDGSQCKHRILVCEFGYYHTAWYGDSVPELIYMPTYNSD